MSRVKEPWFSLQAALLTSFPDLGLCLKILVPSIWGVRGAWEVSGLLGRVQYSAAVENYGPRAFPKII